MVARTALVTGGNRGIGFEVCRGLLRHGLNVVLAAREGGAGREAAAKLAVGVAGSVRSAILDVSSRDSILGCAEHLRADGIHVDVLVNNAGVYPQGTLLEAEASAADETFRTNFWGPFWLCQTFAPGMKRRKYGRIVNVSSGSGSFAEQLPGPAVYCLSKAALNALTVKLASELRASDIKVNSACPGWVRTRMGGRGAPRTPEEGADTIVWLATLPADGPSGGFFRDRRPIAW